MINESLITWKDMDLKKIDKVYEDIRNSVLFEMIDKETRDTIRREMEARLPEYKIKCDEENNPSEIINDGNIMVRVSDPKTLDYINVIF